MEYGILESLNLPWQRLCRPLVEQSFSQMWLKKIVRLGYGLARNHAFIDGNKRIGALMVQLLLKWNGYKLVLKSGELADMFISIANGASSEEDLLHWIQQHI